MPIGEVRKYFGSLFSVFTGLAWAPGVGSRDGYVVSTR